MTSPDWTCVLPEADSSSEDEPSLGCMCRLLKAEPLALDEVSDEGRKKGRRKGRKGSGRCESRMLCFLAVVAVPCDLRPLTSVHFVQRLLLQGLGLGAVQLVEAVVQTGEAGVLVRHDSKVGGSSWGFPPPQNQIVNIRIKDSPLVCSCRSCSQVRRTWGCCWCCQPGGKEQKVESFICSQKIHRFPTEAQTNNHVRFVALFEKESKGNEAEVECSSYISAFYFIIFVIIICYY